MLGFYPEDDYEFLVHEDRGRRIFHGDPEYSLLLQKPANTLPHGGGRRLEPDSYEWQLITRWIRQGTPYGSQSDATLEHIKVSPDVREMNFESSQQLAVTAHYSDGTTRDVTRLASFEANYPEMADCDPKGRVSLQNVPGEVAMMVRYSGQVTLDSGEIIFVSNVSSGQQTMEMGKEFYSVASLFLVVGALAVAFGRVSTASEVVQ